MESRRSRAVRRQWGVGHLHHGVRAAGLGHAEQVGRQLGFAGPPFGRQRLEHGAAPHAGQVTFGEVGMVGHGLTGLCPARNVGRPFALEQRQGARGFEHVLGEDGCAGRECLQHNHRQSADPEERHRRIDAVGCGDAAVVRQDVGVAYQAAVGVRDGFRQRRRPGRGDEHEIIGRPNLRFGRTCQGHNRSRGAWPRCRPWPVAVRPHVHPPQVGDFGKRDRRVTVGQTRQSLGHPVDEVAPCDRPTHQHYLGVGVAQQPGEFGARREGRQRDGQRTDARRGQPGDDPLGAVGEQNADPSSLTHSAGQQRIGQRP